MNGQRGEMTAVMTITTAMILLSTVSPVMKYLYLDHPITTLEMVTGRIVAGFVFLSLLLIPLEGNHLPKLTRHDFYRLSWLGFIGVGLAYTVAAWGLASTSVTHYTLIYSLTPSFIALLSAWRGTDQICWKKGLGIGLTLFGCSLAVITDHLNDADSFQLNAGDFFILTFSLLMATFILLSTPHVQRYGVITANTIMFGFSGGLLLIADFTLTPHPLLFPTFTTFALTAYMGLATAGVFVLRYIALKTLSPATVGVFHSLVPICAIAMAHEWLQEPLHLPTLAGIALVLGGVELVRRS